MQWLKPVTTSLVCLISATLWWGHAKQSPLFNPNSQAARDSQSMGEKVSLELSQEKQLALAYWKRYPDVREHPLWGEQGALGIKGPADHYRHHGRQEGRVFQELITAKDTAREAKLAEAYWSRYPDVAQSPVWGKKSALGVAGPRDHYLLFGQDEGRIWGE